MPSDTASLADTTYRRLRTDVISGRFPPGHKLKIQELAEQLSVSPGLVREALSRLTAEALVNLVPQKGFRVAPIDAEEVKDLTRVRLDIELMCLARAIEIGSIGWEADILAALHHLNRLPHAGRTFDENWTAAHARFHTALVAACDSKWLLRIRDQLFVQGERYRWINIRMSDETRDLRGEHEALAKAVVARDRELASELMAAHLRSTETNTLRFLG